MEDQGKKRTRIPDVINNSVTKNFTQVPNDLLRNPEISGKAKALLCLLLSNQKGWYSYITTLQEMMKEGKVAIYSGLRELEEFGYLKRIHYRDKETKQFKGSFWSYTDYPNKFNMQKAIQFVENEGFYISKKDLESSENPDMENLDMANPNLEIPPLKRPIYKNKNINNTNSSSRSSRKEEKIYDHRQNKQDKHTRSVGDKKNAGSSGEESKYITPDLFDEFWEMYPRKVDKGKAKTIWKRLCNRKNDRPKWDDIKSAVIEQKQTDRWQESKFIPHPSTWLNQSRWEDDPAEMKNYDRESTRKQKPANWYREERKNRSGYSF